MLYALVLIGIAAIGAAGAYWGIRWLIYTAVGVMFLMIFGEAIESAIRKVRQGGRQPQARREGNRRWLAPGQLHLILVTLILVIIQHWKPDLGLFAGGSILFLGCLLGPEIMVWILCGKEVALSGSSGFEAQA